jgi:hypothetical protein
MPAAVQPGLAARIAGAGFAFLPAAATRALLEARAPLTDWEAFADSWNALPVDEYMADRGRYRRRRHAAYAVAADGAVARLPPRPHFQALDYNPLNGGIERWFEPICDAVAQGATLPAILGWCAALFGGLAPGRDWLVEVHQFRIEAAGEGAGQPTPEGMHRDGVDYVLVLLVRRRNIDSGTTLIGTEKDGFFDSFTLTEPFDAALVDDHRVFHGVTPVHAHDPALPACRDVLVVTFAGRDAAAARPPG